MNKKRIGLLCLSIGIAAAVLSLLIKVPDVKKTPQGMFVPPISTAQMQAVFKKHGYDMARCLDGESPVPRLFVQSVPRDFNREKFDEVRPALFFEMMLPVVLRANETLAVEREQVLRLKREFDDAGDLTEQSMRELDEWVKRYDVKDSDDLETLFTALLERVDGVTPTLLLAMAAQDSGFGTSRYAREHNAVFNQRDWDGNGVDPDEEQKEGPQYKIKTFDSLYDAVISQIYYINTNGYLKNYRAARDRYRRTNSPMRGYSVANLLINFPYKPFKYPDIIKHLIRQYGLTPLDFQTLAEQ